MNVSVFFLGTAGKWHWSPFGDFSGDPQDWSTKRATTRRRPRACPEPSAPAAEPWSPPPAHLPLSRRGAAPCKGCARRSDAAKAPPSNHTSQSLSALKSPSRSARPALTRFGSRRNTTGTTRRRTTSSPCRPTGTRGPGPSTRRPLRHRGLRRR